MQLASALTRAVRRFRRTLAHLLRSEPGTVLALAVLLVAIWYAVAQFASAGWWPEGDDAAAALKVRDVFSSHPPLMGMRSTTGFTDPALSSHHPGPLYFYLLALPAALFGFHPLGLLVGCGLIASTAAVGIVHVARRLGGQSLAVTMSAGTLGLIAWGGPDQIARPLNTYPPALPMVLMFLTATALLLGHLDYLWVYAVCASLAAQSQLAYAPVAVALTAVLAAVAAWRWARPDARARRARLRRQLRRRRRRIPWRRRLSPPVRTAVVITLAAWAPVVVELFVGRPNNVTQLLAYVRRGGSAVEGAQSQAFDLLRWLVPEIPGLSEHSRPWVAVCLGVTLVVLAVAARDLSAAWVGTALGLVGVAVEVFVIDHFLRGFFLATYWLTPLVAIAAFVWGWAGWLAWRLLRPVVARGVVPAAAAVVCTVVPLAVAVRVEPAGLRQNQQSAQAALIAERAVRERVPAGSAVRVNNSLGLAWLSASTATAYRLRRDGYHVCTFHPWVFWEDVSFRSWETCPPDSPTVIVVGSDSTAQQRSELPQGLPVLGRSAGGPGVVSFEVWFDDNGDRD